MNRLTSLLLLAVLSFAAFACDSTEDEQSDQERIQREWVVTGVSDEERDLSTEELEQAGTLFISFERSSYTITAENQSGTSTLLSGSYTIVPLTRSLVLQATVQGQTVPVPASYRFTDEGLDITLNSTLLGALLNAMTEPDIEFSGDITMSLQPSPEAELH